MPALTGAQQGCIGFALVALACLAINLIDRNRRSRLTDAERRDEDEYRREESRLW